MVINSTNILPIMIINRIYEHKNLLSLLLVSFLVGLRTYQHPCVNVTPWSDGVTICKKMRSLCTVLHVTINYIKVLSVARKHFYGEFTWPTTITRISVLM